MPYRPTAPPDVSRSTFVPNASGRPRARPAGVIGDDRAATGARPARLYRRLRPAAQAAVTGEREAPCRVPPPRGSPRRVRRHSDLPAPAENTPPSPTAIHTAPTASPAASASTTMPTPVPTITAWPDPSPSPTTAASGLPAGWHHELSCSVDSGVCSVDSTAYQLHLYDAAGRGSPGGRCPFPGGCWLDNFAVGTDGVAYTACRSTTNRCSLTPSMSVARPCSDGRSGQRGTHWR